MSFSSMQSYDSDSDDLTEPLPEVAAELYASADVDLTELSLEVAAELYFSDDDNSTDPRPEVAAELYSSSDDSTEPSPEVATALHASDDFSSVVVEQNGMTFEPALVTYLAYSICEAHNDTLKLSRIIGWQGEILKDGVIGECRAIAAHVSFMRSCSYEELLKAYEWKSLENLGGHLDQIAGWRSVFSKSFRLLDESFSEAPELALQQLARLPDLAMMHRSLTQIYLKLRKISEELKIALRDEYADQVVPTRFAAFNPTIARIFRMCVDAGRLIIANKTEMSDGDLKIEKCQSDLDFCWTHLFRTAAYSLDTLFEEYEGMSFTWRTTLVHVFGHILCFEGLSILKRIENIKSGVEEITNESTKTELLQKLATTSADLQDMLDTHLFLYRATGTWQCNLALEDSRPSMSAEDFEIVYREEHSPNVSTFVSMMDCLTSIYEPLLDARARMCYLKSHPEDKSRLPRPEGRKIMQQLFVNIPRPGDDGWTSRVDELMTQIRERKRKGWDAGTERLISLVNSIWRADSKKIVCDGYEVCLKHTKYQCRIGGEYVQLLLFILIARLTAPNVVPESEYDRRRTDVPQWETKANRIFEQVDELMDDLRKILK